MSRPKVSVIIPCYNLGAYLDEAVDSVLAQTFQDLEIIIVNDGSSDPATNAILKGYDRPMTRVIQAAHRGVSAARNVAIEKSSGDYLCALDPDDRLDPTFLEKTVWILERDPSIAFVSTWLRTFGDEEWEWRQDRCDLVALLAECTVLTAAPVRRAAVVEAGGYDQKLGALFAEDWDLWISIVERGYRGVILPEALFHYRRTRDSNSRRWERPDFVSQVMRALVAKHEASFRKHLLEVLLLKEGRIGELLRTNYDLEDEVDNRLVQEIARRKEEVARLRRRLEAVDHERHAAHQITSLSRANEASRIAIEQLERERADSRGRLAELEAALRHAQWEAGALRNSISWRIMAPARAVYDFLMKLRHPNG
jgi:glycosyltransferase involved in cell wall biosynthesis